MGLSVTQYLGIVAEFPSQDYLYEFLRRQTGQEVDENEEWEDYVEKCIQEHLGLEDPGPWCPELEEGVNPSDPYRVRAEAERRNLDAWKASPEGIHYLRIEGEVREYEDSLRVGMYFSGWAGVDPHRLLVYEPSIRRVWDGELIDLPEHLHVSEEVRDVFERYAEITGVEIGSPFWATWTFTG